tara:strand:+ start:2544 stop:2789 length:246 start_codon:yes stop_codon:yes gene_type:complete
LDTIIYTLDDGQEITVRQLARKLKVTESAARNRLNRHTNPDKVFEPYNPKNGGKPRGKQKKKLEEAKDKDAEMLKFALKHI